MYEWQLVVINSIPSRKELNFQGIQFNMMTKNEFNLWFAYYDSFFLVPHPKLNRRFYSDHVISGADWPTQPCSPLAQIFILFQNFLKSKDNWISSKCQVEEILNIQAQLNDLMYFITLEKTYAVCFWAQDPRRVQASITHFYTFLQILIKAIIPYPTMSLFQSKTANKLCVQLKKLQKLVNQILKCLNPLAHYLYSEKFAQQKKLVTNFFQNWIYFMKKLPNIKRSKLNHVHNLTKFVCLTNPIQICIQSKSVQYAQANRKKSNTVGTKIDVQSYPSIASFKSQLKIGLQQDNKQQLRRCHSCISLKMINYEQQEPFKQQRKKLFFFSDEILKFSQEEENRQKTTTISSLSTLQNKKQSIGKLATNYTANVSNKRIQLSPLKIKRIKAKSFFQLSKSQQKSEIMANSSFCTTKSKQKNRARNKTKFYEQQSQRNEELLSIRSSKQSTIRGRQLTVMTVTKIQGKQVRINTFSYIDDNRQLSLVTGNTKKRGWQRVRQCVKELMERRRLLKVISQKQ